MRTRLLRRARSLAAAAALAAAALPASAASPSGVSLRLDGGSGKSYDVEGSFTVRASSAAVWRVLTDYDRIADFVPSMRRSRVVGTEAGGATLVEQEAVGGAFFLRRAVRVTLEVRRDGDALTFHDVSGKDFRRYDGSWTTHETPAGTVVTYRLRAEPDFLAPGFFVRRGLSRGARDLL